MTSYKIVYQNYDKYSAVIYAVSYNNPIDDIIEISKDIKNKLNNSCFLLFDMLLCNGDNFNRFAECYFNGNEICFDSLNIINLNKDSHLEQINKYYKNNIKQLNNSVLSSSEKFKYAKRD